MSSEITGRPASKPIVLVLDQEHAIRTMLDNSLRLMGFEVRLAANGDVAIGIFRDERIAVVLLDILINSEPDGPAILARLQRINPKVKAVFMTAGVGNYTIEELLARGAADVLVKPFDLHGLRQAILHLV